MKNQELGLSKRYWYGTGVKISKEFYITEDIVLRPAKLRLNINEIAKRTDSMVAYGFVCALSQTICFELLTTTETYHNSALRHWNSQWFLIWLSIYKSHPIAWPLECRASTAEKSDKIIRINTIFGISKAFEDPILVSKKEIQVVASLWPSFEELMGDNAFVHAASIAAMNFSEPRASIRMASIWSGIEAILGLNQELTYRISLLSTLLTETIPENRSQKFKRIKQLYGLRSKCVHGARIDSDKLNAGIKDSLSLLRELIIYFLKRGHLLSEEEKDSLILNA